MLQGKSDFIKTSFLYCLMLMLILFINPYLSMMLHTVIFMFIPGISTTVYSYIIIGLCGAFTETLLLFLVFFGSFYNNKKSGMLVTYISDFFYVIITGNSPIMPTDLPIYYYLIMTLVADVLRFGAIFLSLSLAKNKQRRETKEILGSNYKN